MATYTIENKPDFVNGEWVEIDPIHLGYPVGTPPLKGQIKGKASTNVIDYWIIDFHDHRFEKYPFQCVSLPHVSIIKV